jgi:hypothetical protein
VDDREQEQSLQTSIAHWRADLADFETRKHKERPVQTWMSRRLNRAAVALVVSLVILIPILLLSVHVVDMLNATATVNSFCSAESSGKVNAVYSLLSQRIRKEMTSEQVRDSLRISGLVYCATGVSPDTPQTFPDFANFPNVDTPGGTAQVKVKYVFSLGNTVYGTISLARDGFLGWRVDKVGSIF